MQPAQITLTFRQVINASSTGDFESRVFEDSYIEFIMQAQAYNQEKLYRTFSELKTHKPKSNSLHYKVGFAVGLYVQELGGRIPGVKDSLGVTALPFDTHHFEIIESDIEDRQQHQVAIIYTTPPLTWLGVVGDRLLLVSNDQSYLNNGAQATFMLPLQPQLAISSYKALQLQTEESR
ncbi:MAG TPA: hypothetical protein VM802_08915 [Chitinophaga sp.]|uniref:hypothetical protein n=1 Tax=Chitinophaga sp. TaxID=1869181 RepID=UPI002C7D21A4|nr:hypothetical protein [Chitinophaga sp.]HVI44979.1 hypothetical protein [Chitinophaga sp.]